MITRTGRLTISRFIVDQKLSDTALSEHDPVRPTDWTMPRRSHSSRYSLDRYWLARSPWNSMPVTSPPRVSTAMRSARLTRSVGIRSSMA